MVNITHPKIVVVPGSGFLEDDIQVSQYKQKQNSFLKSALLGSLGLQPLSEKAQVPQDDQEDEGGQGAEAKVGVGRPQEVGRLPQAQGRHEDRGRHDGTGFQGLFWFKTGFSPKCKQT